MDELTIEQARGLLYDEPTEASEAEVCDVTEAAEEAAEASTTAVEALQPAREPNVKDAVGLGIDIVEIDRMAALIARNPRFTERVFSEQERAYCDVKSNPAAHYAARFAAKEAVVKALGTGFSQGIGVRDIEVRLFASGKPVASLSGRAAEVAAEQGVRDISISLTYTRTEAVACALAITEASVRASEQRVDPMEELAKQFKETRSMLDNL